MNTATTHVNPFRAIAALPADFHEVHGRRPYKFETIKAAQAFLHRMEDATLTAAQNMLSVADATGDPEHVALGRQYIEAHQAIAALRVAA